MPKTYDISRLSFLIIEDNQHTRKIIKTILRGFGVFDMMTADTAEKGYEILCTRQIDIIFTDNNLPDQNGVEFVKQVRNNANETNPYVPIIMLSAYTDKKEICMARDAGITEFLCKPISAKSLFLYIVNCMENPRQFVRASDYFGPDRRRVSSRDYKGPERRKQNKAS